MADLRISDAPLLPQDQINDFVKVPTGSGACRARHLSWVAFKGSVQRSEGCSHGPVTGSTRNQGLP